MKLHFVTISSKVLHTILCVSGRCDIARIPSSPHRSPREIYETKPTTKWSRHSVRWTPESRQTEERPSQDCGLLFVPVAPLASYSRTVAPGCILAQPCRRCCHFIGLLYTVKTPRAGSLRGPFRGHPGRCTLVGFQKGIRNIALRAEE